MLIVLPPSETKATGGRGAPLDLDLLSLPSLTPLRRKIADALVTLSGDPAASQKALGLGVSQFDEIERNAQLWSSPTSPAIERYTGVLFDALDYRSLTRAAKVKAADRLAIGSALFGVLRATDPIPAYRLSAGSKLPGFGTLAANWKPALTDALVGLREDLIVDLRSGGYQQLGPIPDAITVTVLTENASGARTVVSHFNKHHKGVLTRSLLGSRKQVRDVNSLAAVAVAGGQRAEIGSDRELIILTD
ncbi:peroxide stress protein YaaA [Nocardia sp. 348MFTsu5.1]|uniref:peroxide stress protein YaaA n=1 Tax=Nocardia sp. 348MFTsu5.1 TaxID=1172185 RepID=UPI00037F9F4A|nr:peroxide stress protein YaaA [Nocardia sp. 348MFTsu5.1]